MTDTDSTWSAGHKGVWAEAPEDDDENWVCDDDCPHPEHKESP